MMAEVKKKPSIPSTKKIINESVRVYRTPTYKNPPPMPKIKPAKPKEK